MPYEIPPIFKGPPESQLKEIYSYLYRLVEAMNIADKSIGGISTQKIIEAIAKDPEKKIPTAQTIEETKALINNTTKKLTEAVMIANGAIERVASDFGDFESRFETNVEETAAALITRYGFEMQISDLQEQSAGFSAYMLKTEGFIKQGFIDTDEAGVPQIGIAIGQGLTSETVIIDGQEYEQLNSTQSCAFYTSSRVAFRLNGREVAYISNQKLYISDVEITGNMTIGGNWAVEASSGSMKLKWAGD